MYSPIPGGEYVAAGRIQGNAGIDGQASRESDCSRGGIQSAIGSDHGLAEADIVRGCRDVPRNARGARARGGEALDKGAPGGAYSESARVGEGSGARYGTAARDRYIVGVRGPCRIHVPCQSESALESDSLGCARVRD
jgi:hypothetical protein